MTVRRTITVSLPPEMQTFIAGRLKTGRYGNASEVVRAALRLLAEHEPDLRTRVGVPDTRGTPDA